MEKTIENEYFEKVEEILEKFPEECRKNYYENKKTVEIIFRDRRNSFTEGEYDDKKNKIYLYHDKRVLSHELFHMAFNDKNKCKQLIDSNNDKKYYYSNGVSFKVNDKLFGYALTEGFVEYLARKVSNIKGQRYNYFFADLLISIYGEEILEYALKNDPMEFYADFRFKNIVEYAITLDSLYEVVRNINFISESYKLNLLGEAQEKGYNEILMAYKRLLKTTKADLVYSIVNLCKLIIAEFNFCKNPKITFEDLKLKMQDLFENSEYSMILDLIEEEEFLKWAEILSKADKKK